MTSTFSGDGSSSSSSDRARSARPLPRGSFISESTPPRRSHGDGRTAHVACGAQAVDSLFEKADGPRSDLPH